MSGSSAADAHGQRVHRVRLEWGPTGAAAIAAGADVAVVVDVLSFTTTLTVAVERGWVVHPFLWRDESAAAHAEELGAVLAVGRFEQRAAATGATASLSPAAMADLAPGSGLERVVLPSPNGSAISVGLRDAGVEVVGACLRNATAVGRWLAPRVTGGAVVAVVPAGERWPDGTLRPAAEDLWGAGAVVDALVLAGVSVPGGVSPEAELAREAFLAVRDRLPERLLACAGGQELAAVDFAADVRVAAELDVSDVVPVLGDDGFRDAR
ncbi:2-phosphosulfolactate phosphatase [Nocardioides sp.]|uniref:2-phosphosulfolactate phosphatase n=1 Tax=Nocardioides sp. TaxID=35761 RepID=UPI00286A3669|nr:2-phosphosulfolactate phosphatase [Nocardioides sp.]